MFCWKHNDITEVAPLTFKPQHRSGLTKIHRITIGSDLISRVSEDMLDHKSAFPARQVLLNSLGNRLLVSMLDTDELWDLESKSLVASITPADVECERTWANDPIQSDRLLLALGGIIKILAWDNLAEVSEPWSVTHTIWSCPLAIKCGQLLEIAIKTTVTSC